MITVNLEEKNEENNWKTEKEKQLADDCCSTEPHPPVRICEKRRIVHTTTTFALRINLVGLNPVCTFPVTLVGGYEQSGECFEL